MYLSVLSLHIAKWRIVFGVVSLVTLIITAMVTMLTYRLLLLPLAVNKYCEKGVTSDYCIASISHQLIYDSQWLSVQFTIYLLLSFILFPLFKNSVGKPVLNLFIVAVISTILISVLTSNRGVELYASMFSPVFIGLIIQALRNRRVVINKI